MEAFSKPACIFLSDSKLSNDGRAQRLIEIAQSSGWQVEAVCFGDDAWDGTASTVRNMPLAPVATLKNRCLNLFFLAAARFLPGDWFLRALAHRPSARRLHKKLMAGNHPNLIIVKHWTMLPSALLLSDRQQIDIWLDENEVFLAEHDDKLYWRLLYKPVISRLANVASGRVEIVTVTSLAQKQNRAIAATGDDLFYLPNSKQPIEKSAVMPQGTTASDRRIEMLYHGLLMPQRGLETILTSLAGCDRKDIFLTIRGYGKPAYIIALKKLARQFGVEDQVAFEPPVAVGQVVEAASKHDAGLFIPSNQGAQLAYSEPNKLHEYMAAGLCVIARSSPSMQTIVEDNDAGITIRETDDASLSDALAACFKALSLEQIQRYRINAHSFEMRLHATQGDKAAIVSKLKTLVSNHTPAG